MVSCYSVTQTAWLASRVTQASVSLPAWLPVQADSSCNPALESLLFLSNCPSRLSPGHGTNHFCLFASLTCLGTGSFSRAPDSLLLQVTTAPFKVPKVPRNTLHWPLLCPISFQTLQALISSFYQDVSIQGQCKSSLPKIPILSFRSFSGCSLLRQPKVGGQSRWRGQKVPLDGFWLSHRLREMSTLERLWPCDALLRSAHLRAAIPVMNFQANKQA